MPPQKKDRAPAAKAEARLAPFIATKNRKA
jgi:hypothetical protein